LLKRGGTAPALGRLGKQVAGPLCPFVRPLDSLEAGAMPRGDSSFGPEEAQAADAAGSALDRDPERAQQILRTLRAALRRFCPPELRHLQEDLAQAAALRVIETLGKVEQPGKVTTSYLWQVAHNLLIDEIRRRGRRGPHLEATVDGAATEGTQVPAALVSSPRPEVALAIRDCLGGLAAARRAAVVLHLQGFRAEEAAAILARAVKAVSNLTYRGLADLRRCLLGKGIKP
jgi:RNA polymerase sigma-70 factor, ECF subfamily